MATNWIIPTVGGMDSILNAAVVNLGAAPLSDGKATALRLAVAKVRGAINRGGVTPLSATAEAVPPEGEQAVLVKAIQTVIGQPGLMPKAQDMKDGFDKLIEEADAWIESCEMGKAVTTPTDPDTGYVGSLYGSESEKVDMGTSPAEEAEADDEEDDD